MTERHHGKKMAPVAPPTIERRRQLIVTATTVIELFQEKSATVNLSLHIDTVVDNEKETPVVTSQLAPPEEVVDSTTLTTQKSLVLIVPESKSFSSALKNQRCSPIPWYRYGSG
ncbi:hypothetical protein AVEN_178953-1 [Araneus ventricosus]|uniref:Uncharacterized protein n=1 Tax=Araneus ventricosus TaxID=182803 RepID=A0A4Y2NRQ3_ARAVE|nr:hypothetical protein AVEN_178953-1 [Araneus ventricosus]